jgi:hypothetical protein
LRALARVTLGYFPPLKTRLRRLAMASAVTRHAAVQVPSAEPSGIHAEKELPASARRIYSELKAAMAVRSAAGA